MGAWGGTPKRGQGPRLSKRAAENAHVLPKGSIKIGAQASRSEVPLLRSWKPSCTARKEARPMRSVVQRRALAVHHSTDPVSAPSHCCACSLGASTQARE